MQKPIKTILIFLFVLISTIFFGQNQTENSLLIKENLDFPFGTIVKMKVEIIDGASLNLKALQGQYLIKIKEINDKSLEKPVIMEFVDESREFPTNNFALYELLYEKEVENGLSSDKIAEMNKNYVGKIVVVLGYESGKFTGSPNKSEYVKTNVNSFQLVNQDYGFHFKNYIVIDSKL
ncbi:hypothetical protein J3D55_002118 [Chryseobacterium ginsenosidimutans]|uniref:hypothetical protein n=1 Tax=Chryseobacterium ginsenosidimutans TaxID=687846 RepID=UPI00216834B9|nr:hypothetical protein [Chryseobacterium ginsenosidimutans]MCS3869202.1 hypothetical protein [Chryseobacterium ginsenosidimutans]